MDISIACYNCGAELNERSSYSRAASVYQFFMPCANCMTDVRKEGHDEGYDEGHSVGYDVGYEAGQASIRDDVREMLKTVQEADCDASKAGAISEPASSS